jgi:hypothetical protein
MQGGRKQSQIWRQEAQWERILSAFRHSSQKHLQVHPWSPGLFCDDDDEEVVAEPDGNATPANRRWMLGARCSITPCLYPAYTRHIPGSDQPPNPQSRCTRGIRPIPVRVSRFATAVSRAKDSCTSSNKLEGRKEPLRPLHTHTT